MLNVLLYLPMTITGWFFKISIECKKENKIKTSKVSGTLYSVDCMQFVVSMFVLLMHLFKKCGVMINHSSINKNFRYTHFKNNLFDPRTNGISFYNNEFQRKDIPWCCKNLNMLYKQNLVASRYFALNCCITEQYC